ncbi:MAG: 1-deoxy-D-xylulose-5-phosphate synthase [Mycoplasmoidaceae bacterium]
MNIKNIKSANELKNASFKDLNKLCKSIREEIFDLSNNKKVHLSSNLGIVELSVILVKHFPNPNNKIFYDTGHQSYAHKMLTNRLSYIKTIRDFNGLSGFQCNKESEYDFYSSGHAGNSLSIAQGFNESSNENKAITVIGDASISNGLAFEALNNIGFNKTKMLIILNDNGMSISKSVGGLSISLNNMNYKNFLYPFIKNLSNHKQIESLFRFEKKLNKNNFFTDLGFCYIGKINGHNLKALDKAIIKGIFYTNFFPTIIHVKTTKGKGIKELETNNPKYHSFVDEIFDDEKETFSDISSNYLSNKIANNKNIKIISSAMIYSSNLNKIENKFPLNCEDVGISEEHSIAKAAGIELANKKAVISIYSTFMQRGYDQILNDVCRESLPVLFLVDRADLSYGDGNTHHGIYDIGMIKSIPNTVICSPSTKNELEQLIDIGLENKKNSIFIRFSNEKPFNSNESKIKYGEWKYLKNKNSLTCIISYGNWINKIYYEYKDYKVDILNAIFIHGFDEKKVINMIKKYKKIIFYERVYKAGTLYNSIVELLNKNNLKIKCELICFQDNNIGFGNSQLLNEKNNMLVQEIKKYI